MFCMSNKIIELRINVHNVGHCKRHNILDNEQRGVVSDCFTI